jgi:hypothetical protein
MIEHADSSRSTTAIERSVSRAPLVIQRAIQKRRAEMGLPPLRLTWGMDEARAAIEATKAVVKRHRAAVARAALAVARMKAAAAG